MKVTETLERSIRAFQKINFVRGLLFLLITAFYTAWHAAHTEGLIGTVNTVILVATAVYLVFYIAVYCSKAKSGVKRVGKILYRIVKFFMYLVLAYLSVQSIVAATDTPQLISVLFAILMPVLMATQIVFDVAGCILRYEMKCVIRTGNAFANFFLRKNKCGCSERSNERRSF
ncbi:MAG: hypothetical protein J5993_01015 [Clostridia bacterium]|nr:hypothetical protein [Clostridia bacterium]